MGRVGEEADAGGGDLVTDPGAATATAVDRLALVGDAGAGAPVGVDHQVGDRRRRQDGVVAPGGQVDAALGPGEALGDRRGHRRGVDVAEVAGRATGPGAPGE